MRPPPDIRVLQTTMDLQMYDKEPEDHLENTVKALSPAAPQGTRKGLRASHDKTNQTSHEEPQTPNQDPAESKTLMSGGGRRLRQGEKAPFFLQTTIDLQMYDKEPKDHL